MRSRTSKKNPGPGRAIAPAGPTCRHGGRDRGNTVLGAALLGGIIWAACPLWAGDTEPPKGLKDAATFMSKSAAAVPNADLKGRIKHAAWSLVVGELAIDPQRGMLYSAGVDVLGSGLAELDRIEAELKADPLKEKEISTSPVLAMQLDGARVRRERVEAKLNLSRKEERERLAQLREIVSAYRDVANVLAVSNAHFLTGDFESTRSTNQEASKKLADLEAIVNHRRDYYLFSDEPDLNAAASSELKFVTSAPQPFSDDMKPHMAALQALAIYRLATGGPEPPEAKLLESAQTLAERALGNGPDKNVIALYVLGNVRRELGLLLTAKEPLDSQAHRGAAPLFEAARESFKTLQSMRAKHPEPLKGIGAEVDQHVRELSSPDVFLAEAERLTLAGRLVEAHSLLGRGMRYHRSAPLLIARLETARRAELDLDTASDELKLGTTAGLIREDDPQGRLIASKLALARAWRIATSSLEKMGIRERSDLENAVVAQQQALDRIAAAEPEMTLQLRAYSSFAGALRSMVNPTPDAERQEVELRQAAGAASGLLAQLAEEKREGWASVSLREALVACRLAQGFLAVRVLPSYRDDAINAFAAAADEQVKLPYQGTTLKVLGSPLVTAMLSRPEGQSIRLAQEERQLRQVIARFLEGAFSQSLGSDSGAASQMAAALDEIQGMAGNLPSDATPLDAGRMLDRSDTADARKSTFRQIRSFSVLSFVKAGQVRRGLVEAVRTVAGDDLPALSEEAAFQAITPDLLNRAVRGTTSPMEAFTLGAALEAQATSPQPGRVPSAWLAVALQAQTRAKALFDGSKATRDRFPELVALNSQAIRRLSSPEDDITEARRLRQQGRFPEATARLRFALVRHPAAPVVRAELALCLCDQVDLGQADASALDEALRSLQPYRGTAASGLALVIGDIEERLGRTDQALQSYRSVLARSQSVEERIKANARIAILVMRPGH
jgi:tetratricopeptide (TPR) repeat protein